MSNKLLYEAILKNNIKEFASILDQNPSLINTTLSGDSWLNIAAGRNRVAMMEVLVERGISVNTDLGKVSPLKSAANNGAFEAVRWLVSKNANVNGREGQAPPLAGAIHSKSIEVVSFLIKNGAKTNVQWGHFNYTPLTYAKALGHEEIANYLAQHKANLNQKLNVFEEVDRYLESHFGKHSLLVHNLSDEDHPIKINIINYIEEDPCTIIATSGMSLKPMNVPEGAEDYRYAEMLMYLPKNWPGLKEKNRGSSLYSWPVEWLLRIARFPFENDTWTGYPTAIFSNEEPPEAFARNTKLSCLLAIANPDEYGCLQREDGTKVQFYSVYPIYTEERAYHDRYGTNALLDRFEQCGVSTVVDINRTNVAKV